MDGGGGNGSWPLSAFALGTMGSGWAMTRPSILSIGGVLLGSSPGKVMCFWGSLIARWTLIVDASAPASFGSVVGMGDRDGSSSVLGR